MKSLASIFKRIYLEILARIFPMVFVKNSGIRFGDNCRFIAPRIQTFGSDPYLIKLGNKVSLSAGVRFITHDGGVWVLRNLYEECRNIDLFGQIIIEDNVFIGMNVTILPGVTIHSNCIIGAGSIVTKNIPKNSVVAGVPAKVVCGIDEYRLKNKANFSNTKHLSEKEKTKFVASMFEKK